MTNQTQIQLELVSKLYKQAIKLYPDLSIEVCFDNKPGFNNEFNPGQQTYELCTLILKNEDIKHQTYYYYYLICDQDQDPSLGSIVVDTSYNENIELGSYQAIQTDSLLNSTIQAEIQRFLFR